ncbi:MAG TPA: hypothetical protein VK464_04955 [Symbiobacteriaceae bacterium]|nr:hypothetical protein [Symbiobacteriaceae bacterium]
MCLTILGLTITIKRAPAPDRPQVLPRRKTARELRDEAWQTAVFLTAIGDLRQHH